jgi:hypothetical protein
MAVMVDLGKNRLIKAMEGERHTDDVCTRAALRLFVLVPARIMLCLNTVYNRILFLSIRKEKNFILILLPSHLLTGHSRSRGNDR